MYSSFMEKLKEQLQSELPGEDAQYLMAPQMRGRRETLLKKNPNPRKSAVMALFYPHHHQPHLVLTLRHEYEGVHSGQVSFPGGRMEPEDTSEQHTALRETEEEIGVPMQSIEIIGELTHLYIPPSNFLVYPFVGMLHEKPEFNPDPIEVNKLIEASVDELKDDEIIKSREMQLANKMVVRTPYFDVQGHVVWGATAMMLSELMQIVKRM